MSAQEGIFMDSGEYIADSKIAYFSISLPKQDLEKSLLVLNKNVMVVSVQSEFKSIQQAVANMENSGTIVIFPGIYNENVKAWGKYIELYGVNKDTCILESFSSSYYSPPLEIGAGVVKNITIRAVDRDSGASTLFAYGVHIEDHFLYDNTLLFENCDISSDFNSAVGIGLRGGCEVIFRDVSMTGKENGLFCHDSAYSSYTGLQKISLTNCVVNGLEGKQAMRFDSQGVKGAQIIVHFYNTILNNVNAITPDTLLYTQNNNGAGTDDNWMGLKNYYITHESSNNKPELLNYQ